MDLNKKKILEALPVSLVITFVLLVFLEKVNILSINSLKRNNKDLDLDGYISLRYKGDDCDDNDASINPSAQDIPDDGIDQNCDGADNSLSVSNENDLDNDGFSSNIDCNDTDNGVFPNAKEIFNFVDDNCNFQIDEGFKSLIVFEDFVISDYSSNTIIKSSKKIISTGYIEEAYLYLEAGVDNPLSPLTKYDSIYLYFDLPKTSGHLVQTASLNTGVVGSNLTTLIYDLKKIPFRNTPSTKDLLVLLNKNGQYNIGAFVATERYGKIVKLILAYKGGSITLR